MKLKYQEIEFIDFDDDYKKLTLNFLNSWIRFFSGNSFNPKIYIQNNNIGYLYNCGHHYDESWVFIHMPTRWQINLELYEWSQYFTSFEGKNPKEIFKFKITDGKKQVTEISTIFETITNIMREKL